MKKVTQIFLLFFIMLFVISCQKETTLSEKNINLINHTDLEALELHEEYNTSKIQEKNNENITNANNNKDQTQTRVYANLLVDEKETIFFENNTIQLQQVQPNNSVNMFINDDFLTDLEENQEIIINETAFLKIVNIKNDNVVSRKGDLVKLFFTVRGRAVQMYLYEGHTKSFQIGEEIFEITLKTVGDSQREVTFEINDMIIGPLKERELAYYNDKKPDESIFVMSIFVQDEVYEITKDSIDLEVHTKEKINKS